jgi:HD-GYP domain-containing protein (c-di-GMP phosphodiesterase class II)
VRGVVLDERKLGALERAGIHAVYIDDALGRGIEVPHALSDETRARASAALGTAFERIRGPAHGEAAPPPPISMEALGELREVARLIADEIAGCGDAIFALQDLALADSYTLQHSIDVTALGLLIARRVFHERGWVDYRRERRFDRIDDRLVQLGLGLMLHDIGKLIVPAEVLNKPGALDDAEWELMRRHPTAGFDMLRSAVISPLSRIVVRSHHERWDGAGYPDGKAGESIHQFARIAAMADVYDAVTSARPYREAREPHEGWRVIVQGAGTAFDPDLVAIFRRAVAPYPPGSEIVLDDGRVGVVVSVPPDRLEEPRVRIGWDADGQPVMPYELELVQLPGMDAAAA